MYIHIQSHLQNIVQLSCRLPQLEPIPKSRFWRTDSVRACQFTNRVESSNPVAPCSEVSFPRPWLSGLARKIYNTDRQESVSSPAVAQSTIENIDPNKSLPLPSAMPSAPISTVGAVLLALAAEANPTMRLADSAIGKSVEGADISTTPSNLTTVPAHTHYDESGFTRVFDRDTGYNTHSDDRDGRDTCNSINMALHWNTQQARANALFAAETRRLN